MKNNSILDFFGYEHLPHDLQTISKPFSVLAISISQIKTENQEEIKASLRKLLEAKDCAVRASLKVKKKET